jgi:hypothetical protein
MMPATAEPQSGAKRRSRAPTRVKRFIAIGLIFAAQVGILFWLGNPPPRKTSPVPQVPVIHIGDRGLQELLAVQDPTLFILPHRDNFSGEAWLKIQPQKFSPTNWTEPAQLLDLPREQLGSAFVAFMQTNLPPRFQPRIDSTLGASEAGPAPLPSISVPSRLRVEGDLARLRLLVLPHLPPQTNSDLLTNTVIHLVVDAQGTPYSSVIWERSGSQEADMEALTNFAKVIRFAPPEAAALGAVPADKMTSGKLIFEWQTVPPLPTNAPPPTL